MAKLTKAQEAELARLRDERDAARALAWPNFPKPTPLPEPAGDGVVAGWTQNPRSRIVARGWRRGLVWYTSDPRKLRDSYSEGYRQGPPLYATAREAWLAMYHELAAEYGKTLARVLRHADAPAPKSGEEEAA